MALTKKLRFEVFKRDSFTCQYCGRKAPDVPLHVDHIEPRADGGRGDPGNLVTACEDCNLGKGATSLDDHASIEMRRFVHRYQRECSNAPPPGTLVRFWKQCIEPSLPDDVAGCGDIVIDLLLDEYETGTPSPCPARYGVWPWSSHWSALQGLVLPWEEPGSLSIGGHDA